MGTDAGPSALYTIAKETASFIESKVSNATLKHPRVAIVCGSGLGGIADTIEQDEKVEIPYSDIPNFPKTTVVGHAGKLVFGFMSSNKVPVVLLVGRAQYVSLSFLYHSYLTIIHSFYEGHAIDQVTFATRVCKLLKVETMVGMSISHTMLVNLLTFLQVTNAAGGLNPSYSVGDIVVINDVSFAPASCMPFADTV